MTSKKARHFVAIFVPLGLITLSAFIIWKFPHQEIAHTLVFALLLLAILANNLIPRTRATLVTASLATAALLTTEIVTATLPESSELLYVACLWLVSILLLWEQKPNLIDLDELKSALHHGPTGMLITDLHGTILSASEQLAQVMRVAPSTMVGSPISDYVDHSVWEFIADREQDLLAGDSIELDFDVTHSDGQTHSLIGHGKIAHDRSGVPRYYVIQVADLSRERAAKRALLVASQQMHKILRSSSDLALVTDHKWMVTFVNEQVEAFVGAPSSEVVNTPVYECVDVSDRKRFIEALQEFAQQELREIEVEDLHLVAAPELTVTAHIVRLTEQNTADCAIVFDTSARVAANKDGYESNAQLSQVFYNSPDAILIYRADDNTILDFNEGFTRLLGYHREDAIGESINDIVFIHNPTERELLIEKINAEREVLDFETILKTANGDLAHAEISLRYIEFDNQLCLLCIGRDITKRVSAEVALVETEEKFEKVFTQSPDGMVILRQSDGVITDLNEAIRTRSGYKRSELLGSSIYTTQVIDADQLSEVTAGLATTRMLANKSVNLRAKSGEVVPCLISASLLELSGENYVMIIAKDISKQRKTEERLRRSEERFRGIFENAPIGILLIDMQGRVFQANHTAAELLAYDEADMNGLHVSRLVPTEERQTLKDHLTTLDIDHESSMREERRMVCQNGLEVWTNFHVVLQRNGKGEPLYYIIQVADISDLKRGQKRMEQMAFYDTLTNLANRRLFQERLGHAIERSVRSRKTSALLYLDLDNFKRVNDTLGHQVGDHLLREVAERLQDCVRKEDTVGRTGGDEFNILLDDVNTPADAGLVAQKILNHLREPIQVSGHPLIVTTSIGITTLPTDGLDPNLLMRNADLAMYRAKERGRNNYQFYSDDMNTNAVSRLRTEYEIRQALDNKEFELFFQPKVSIQSCEIIGFEALIRWNHPERGVLSPDEFIEIAEDTGSIIDIGSWIIEEACRACATLNENHRTPVSIAVNISPRQFRDPNLVTTVRKNLREAELNAADIEIEITETMLMHDVEAAQETVLRLSELGVRLAIDDFGTGYSSLNYLKRFPINTVKVDKSFVLDLPSNTDDMAITRAVIAMAHQLKMEVVAEGVETAEQFEFLAKQKCEYAQGWLFSKAVPLEEAAKLLEQDLSIVSES